MSSGVNFASDNQAGIHPEVLGALVAANAGSAPSYGGDPVTEHAEALLRDQFGAEATVQLVFNGTGANVIGLQAMLRPYESVLCAATSHIVTDECGAPERFLGSKLIGVPTPDGKLTPGVLAPFIGGVGDQHHAQPRVVSVTESTELGTVYELNEIRALGEWAHERGMRLHLDGARICNAAAALGVELSAFASIGVDVLTVGATKNGAMGAEAVVYLDQGLGTGSPFTRKQATQLASKMRFLSAQFVALFDGDLWWRNATHANAMASRLAAGIGDLDGVRICHPVQANAVFAELDRSAIAVLQERFRFHIWDEARAQVRWMTSFETSPDDVDAFVDAVAGAVAPASR